MLPPSAATHCNILQRTATHCIHTTGQYAICAHFLDQIVRALPPGAATNCNTLQRTSMHCNTLKCAQHTAYTLRGSTACLHNCLRASPTCCNTRQYTSTHCTTLQHAATHCNNLQDTATHCIHITGLYAMCAHCLDQIVCGLLQGAAIHGNMLQRTALNYKFLQRTGTPYNALQKTAYTPQRIYSMCSLP